MIRKLTQSPLVMNNIFPPINGHFRPTSDDLHNLTTTAPAEMHSTSKPQQIRRHHTMEQHRRTPLRSTSLLPSPGTRYVTAAAAAAAAVASPTASGSPLLRSPSFVQTGSSTQFEPAKIIYRSSDFAWNDHPTSAGIAHQTLRAPSPVKNKLSTSARPIPNGTINENSTQTNSNVQPVTSTTPSGYPSNIRDDMNNGDLLLNATAKARQAARVQRTNSYLDKSSGTTGHGVPMRSESYRSSRLDYAIRSRHTSSKQRNYISSKTSFYDINAGEFYVNGTQDENIYYHQQPMNNSQRLNGSTFDLTTSRKPFTTHKSNSFNVPPNQNSSQDVYRNETNLARFAVRGTPSKDQQKHRYTPGVPTSSSTTPAERRYSSEQSYKSRDANDSYAYTNVKKYIEENDLMPPEKEKIIRNWAIDVEKYRHQLQRYD